MSIQKLWSSCLLAGLLLACEPTQMPSIAIQEVVKLEAEEFEGMQKANNDLALTEWDTSDDGWENDTSALWGVPNPTPIDTTLADVSLNPAGNYQTVCQKAQGQWAFFAQQFEKDSVISEECRWAFTNLLVKQIFPHWYGTPWDYEGHTNVPQKGQVACGYFVSTTLKHAGIPINRYKLAQAYSTKIASVLQGKSPVKNYRNIPVENFVEQFKKDFPEGLYTVGLSTHVGFLWHKNNHLYFIHSDYSYNGGVKIENALESPSLASSYIYCIGHITHSDYLLEHWLTQEEIIVAPMT